MSFSTSNSNLSLDMSTIIKRTRCPICFEACVEPKILKCGHTICVCCTRVLIRNGKESSDDSSFPQFSCPCCREKHGCYSTLASNLVLKSLIENCTEYRCRQRKIKLREKKNDGGNGDNDVHPPANCDLRKLSEDVRVRLTAEVYDDLLRVLYKAALKGEEFILIDNSEMIRKIKNCSDLLAPFLFSNNVYSLSIGQSRVLIELAKRAFDRHKLLFLNESTPTSTQPPSK